jgi:23S rRNA (guanosine2251-2'-O)-methyltransferase
MSSKQHQIIYGIHAVESAIRNHADSVLQVYLQQGKTDSRLGRIAGLAKRAGLSVQTMSAQKIRERCEGGRHQGVVAEIRAQSAPTIALEDLLQRDRLLLLILDEVQDPHNIGACLRTADAVGVDAVIVSKNRSPGLTPVIRKVASGAAETVPYIMVSNLARALDTIRQENVWVLGTSGDADETIYSSNAASSQRLALVMGSEGKGMRRLTREACDQVVSIPMQGSVESLNISVATAVCLFEIRRQQSSMATA